VAALDEASALAAHGGYVAEIADLRLGGSDGHEGLELLRRVLTRPCSDAPSC
jgi:hypothetical protein